MAAAGGERVALGSAVFALIEPHPGRAREFNRWYERDHLFSAIRSLPWTLASTRWVATRSLKAMRHPEGGGVVEPLERGSYLTTVWMQAGHDEERQRFSAERRRAAEQEGHLYPHRDHVHTGTYRYLGGALRDPDGVPPELALDHGYPGLVLVWLEARAGSLPRVAEQLLAGLLPRWLGASPLAMALLFTPRPHPAHYPPDIPPPDGLGRRLLVASFVEEDPRSCWAPCFAGLAARLEAEAACRVALVAPFVPTRPGTDFLADEL